MDVTVDSVWLASVASFEICIPCHEPGPACAAVSSARSRSIAVDPSAARNGMLTRLHAALAEAARGGRNNP